MAGWFVRVHGAAVVRRPLWTRIGRLRRRIEHDGAAVEVERGLEPLVRRAAAGSDRIRQLPLPVYAAFEILVDDDSEWPALILRVAATYVRVVGRSSDVEVATRLVQLLNRLLGEDARRPRTARFWARGTF